jgi:peptidoglycan/LPS O-acetylase OafA/YrhL
MWSLAVEEQFYLLFPLVCFLVPVRRLWLLVLTTIAVSLGFRLTGTYGVVDSLYLTDGRTEVRMIALALGAWLALDGKRPALPPTSTAAILVVGGGLLTWFARRGQVGWFDPVGLGGAVLLVWLAVSQRFRLRNALLAYVGRRCYGYYLIHVFVLIAVARWLPDAVTPIQAVLYLAATAALAHFSFACIERPLLRLAPAEPTVALEGRPASAMEVAAGAAR